MDVMPFLLRSSSFLPQGGGMEHIMSFLTLHLPAGLVLGGPGQGVTLPSFLSPQAGCVRQASLSGFWELPSPHPPLA